MGKKFLGDTPEERADNVAWLKGLVPKFMTALGFAVLIFFANNQHLFR